MASNLRNRRRQLDFDKSSEHHQLSQQQSTSNTILLHRLWAGRTSTFILYSCWFLPLAIATLTYAGEPVKVKSEDLPLHHFDAYFRIYGHLLLFMCWALRAIPTLLLPHSLVSRSTNYIWTPFFIYTFQAALRYLLYRLHVAGVIFKPGGIWAFFSGDIPKSHYPHIMSDHILLSAAVVGGLIAEVGMPFLDTNISHSSSNINNNSNSNNSGFMRLERAKEIGKLVYAGCAAVLALLVICESYFTARYFHPPTEVIQATVLGLVVFQLPLLQYTYGGFRKLEEEGMAMMHGVGGGDGGVNPWANGAY